MSLLEIRDLHTYFDTSKGVIKAVQGVNLTLETGETIGIVGESGSGKSQTIMSIIKLFESNQRIASGEVWFDGNKISTYSEHEMSAIRGKDIAVIFQDSISCLNPVFTVNQQMSELLIFHRKLSKKQARQEAIRLLESVKIPKPNKVIDQYPHQLSGGMSQRVMIAIALACQPKILIADEPTTALDVIIQAEILELMRDLKSEFNTSILFISHDLGVVSGIADRIVVMNQGRIVEEGPTHDVINQPKHPYTRQLLNAFLMTDIQENNTFKGYLDSLANKKEDGYMVHWPHDGDNDWVSVGDKHYILADAVMKGENL